MLPFILGTLALIIMSLVGHITTDNKPIDYSLQTISTRPQASQVIHRWQAMAASFQSCHDPLLALKIMKVESNFNNIRALRESSTGLMQVKPETARWIGCKAQNERDLLKVELNVSCGCRYLAKLGTRYRSIQQVIVSYNAGSPIICKSGRLNNGRPCTVGKYINADYYYKVVGAKI